MGRRRGSGNIPIRDLKEVAVMGATKVSEDYIRQEVKIPADSVTLEGELIIPADARGLVVFAHGSGSSRHSPRNKYVAEVLRRSNLGTLLFDLLTADEEAVDLQTRHLRFDIRLLADRLAAGVKWLKGRDETGQLKIGLFGSSTGAAAALVAAAELGDAVGAVVSRGGRPDLAGKHLERVEAPVLMVVGGADKAVIGLNQLAFEQMRCEREIKIVPGATHLFEEPGTLDAVAGMAAAWFADRLR